MNSACITGVLACIISSLLTCIHSVYLTSWHVLCQCQSGVSSTSCCHPSGLSSKFSTTWAGNGHGQQSLQAQVLTVGHLHGTLDKGHIGAVVPAEIAAKNGSITGRKANVRRTGELLSRLVAIGEAGPPQVVVLQATGIEMTAENLDAAVTGKNAVQGPAITAKLSAISKCWTRARPSF